MDSKFESTMEEIVRAITEAGYDPYDQLYGYVNRGKEEYITRNGDAREKIKKLNWLKIKQYVEDWKCGSDGSGRMGETNPGREEKTALSKSEGNA